MNTAILEYLQKHFPSTMKAFVEELESKQLSVSLPKEDESASSLKKDILERKWTTIGRLKRDCLELDRQIKQLREQNICEKCEGMAELGGGLGKGKQGGDLLPREPEKYALTGHRGRVTKVALHPFYNLAASSSEDSSIKLWDYDTGE